MAKARQIVKRRKAVRNIRKITQTMQLIATARFQKCLQRAIASKPYTQKITEMIQTLGARRAGDHPLLKANENRADSVLLVITANRGLCGAYNASLLRTMMAARRGLLEQGLSPRMEVVGKKGLNYLKFMGVAVAERITDVEDRIAFGRVSDMAERYMRLFMENRIARVDVAYTQFHSVSTQRPVVAQLLPIQAEAAAPAHQANEPPQRQVEFEFSPPPQQLLARLIPEAVKVRLFQFFNDAIVSEQVSRMVAMKAATDAAGDMIRFLTRQYNRARQTQITLELADIVGGANAVS